MALAEQHQPSDNDTAVVPGPQRRRRNTVKQRAVLAVLRGSERFRSARQLYTDLHQQYSLRIGLTSIYRILHTLADEQVAETQRAENGETLYRARSAAEHRHYLVCRRCGEAVGFTVPALEQHTINLTEQHHFVEVTHYIDVYGICPGCTQATIDRHLRATASADVGRSKSRTRHSRGTGRISQ